MPTRLPAITPMLAVTATLPSDQEAYAFEYKWDGMRALVRLDGGKLRITSRSGQDISARFPELAGLADDLPDRTILDGEIVALGANGRPDFGRLQGRMGLVDPATIRRKARLTPIHYLVFDVPVLEGLSLVELPFLERRRALESLRLAGPFWETPPSHVGVGSAMLSVSQSMGLEGVMAKRLDSRYTAGQRSPRWLKIRNRLRQEFVIGGWTAGEGGRRGTLGALLLGHYGAGGPAAKLHYVGRVGSGFEDETLARLVMQLKALSRVASPFDSSADEEDGDVIFVEPQMVAEVEFSGLTGHRMLRQAVFKGLRTDKAPGDVVWEQVEHGPIRAAAADENYSSMDAEEVDEWQERSGADPSASAS